MANKIINEEQVVGKKYEQYIEEFLEYQKVNLKDGWLTLFKKLEETKKFITEWNRKDLDDFILTLDSVSVNSINKYLQFIRKFYNFVCMKNSIQPKGLYLTYDLKRYINYERFIKCTLDRNRYDWLKNLLTVSTDKGELNYRDKVLLELAWYGLNANEIKNLKVADFNKINDNNAILHLENRDILITDSEFIRDIEETINQEEYYIPESEFRKEQYRKLRDTEYLIRPVDTRISKTQTVANPAQLLTKAFARIEGFPDVELENLSLEDIKRSRIIDMFWNGATIEQVKEFVGKKTDSDLYWLEEVANKIKNM